MAELIPFALKDAPALIESVFPAQMVSFEAQAERKAGGAQTLTALGAYWKGRKPLILVRSIILASLLPKTHDSEKDLEIFEKLMAFDEGGLARRAFAKDAVKPRDIANKLDLISPWDDFSYSINSPNLSNDDVDFWRFPLDIDDAGISIRWKPDVDRSRRVHLISRFLDRLPSYFDKVLYCKRPEEVNQVWLYAPIWNDVNRHYSEYGINVHSHQELVEQFGVLRFGHRPRVGDTFSGGGSIPFEASRIGCDAYASDLNPVSAMLTWGGKHIIGATRQRQSAISDSQIEIVQGVDQEISDLAIEENEKGDRIRLLLYCAYVTCPETGWRVPLLPTLVVSTRSRCVSRLCANHEHRRFDIEIITQATQEQIEEAKTGTIKDGMLVYELDGKGYRVSIKTIRGDYRDTDGRSRNRLRQWALHDFSPSPDDIFQERLYAIQWIKKETLGLSRQATFFAAVTDADLDRERKVADIVARSLPDWQTDGLVPDMDIEPGDKTDEPIRTRGWTHWHHLFSPRQILVNSLVLKHSATPESRLLFGRVLDFNSKLTTWVGPSNRDKNNNTFSQQKLSPLVNRAERGWVFLQDAIKYSPKRSNDLVSEYVVKTGAASSVDAVCDLWVTDPPYADAVNYHEITEFFIAWLRKNPPAPFNEWTWDSRRALAIKGSGDDFRRGMVDAYKAMAAHMPDNGMQCVMFTHQDTGVWSDMVGIFWAAGLQVVGAWYIATETTSELKKGGYVQGTVILMLRKRKPGERPGFKQQILPIVNREVEQQIHQMMNLNTETEVKLGEPVFNDADLQMGGYAAALKVLTHFTEIGGEDVTKFALRPRARGETTVVDEIVQQASEAANNLLVPEGLAKDTWQSIRGIQRFYLRMMDMESTGASKLDNYQNFAKAFRVQDYAKVMANTTANKARLKAINEFEPRDLGEHTEIGGTDLGRLLVGVQELLKEKPAEVVVSAIQDDMPDFLEARPRLIDMSEYLARHTANKEGKGAAELLAARIRNMRLG